MDRALDSGSRCAGSTPVRRADGHTVEGCGFFIFCAAGQAAAESPAVAGYCLTQFTDVEQEKNGLLTIGREEKFPADEIRRINAVRSPAGL